MNDLVKKFVFISSVFLISFVALMICLAESKQMKKNEISSFIKVTNSIDISLVHNANFLRNSSTANFFDIFSTDPQLMEQEIPTFFIKAKTNE